MDKAEKQGTGYTGRSRPQDRETAYAKSQALGRIYRHMISPSGGTTGQHQRTRGVLYIATGLPHIQAAIESAVSVRKTNPNLPIHLFADLLQQKFDLNVGIKMNPFTSWENIPNPHRRSKVDYIAATPFEETLYLDTDTRVLCGLHDPFRLLERFDVALAHAHRREVLQKNERLTIRVPSAFPEFNSGVLFYKRNFETIKAFQSWQQRYYEGKLNVDQPALREILWSNNLRIATLPPEYNVRFLKYILMWSKDEAQPKILHLGFYRRGMGYYYQRWRRSIVRRFSRHTQLS